MSLKKWSWALKIGLAFIVLSNLAAESHGELKMGKLFNDLLDSYDRNIRPARNYSQTVTVELYLKLDQIIELNFDESWMTTRVTVQQEWSDFQLQWSPSSYDYITEIVLPAERVWIPDIAVYNNADGHLRVIPDTVRVDKNGRIKANTYSIIKSACDLDKTSFPFDTQECFIKFGSWTHDGKQLDIRHKHERPDNASIENSVDLTQYYESPEWTISEVHAIRHDKYYDCCKDQNFPDIFFNFKLRRRAYSYVISLILPWIIFTFLPLFAFLLPTKSNLKVTYSVFLLLLLLSTLAISGSSTNFPIFLMRKYYVFTTIVVALTLLSNVIILNIHARKADSVPQYLRNIGKRLAEYVFIEWPDSPQSAKETPSAETADGTAIEANQIDKTTDERRAGASAGQLASGSEKEWEYIAHVLDRVLLGVFSTVCLIGVVIILV